MKKHIYIILALLSFSITSCKKESLQTYLIDTQEKKEFSHISIPSSIIQLSANSVSKEDQEAYNSIEKINLTGLLLKNASEGQYETEKQKLKSLLKNSDYKTLINFKSKGNNATLYYTGSTDAIDEIIVFGYGNEIGVGIARILGNNMNPNAIIKMLKATNINEDDIKNKFQNILGNFK